VTVAEAAFLRVATAAVGCTRLDFRHGFPPAHDGRREV
jgi:hypothetical protein